MVDTIYDVIIVGGGPAGLTAGIYASRAKLKVLLLEKMGCGGNSAITDWIENYPGFTDGIGGFDLGSKFEAQAKKFGTEVIYGEVKNINIEGNLKAVLTENGKYSAKAIILACGAQFKKAGVPGEIELLGKGVSYCATCDAPFFRDKDVVVVGGGDSAIQEAIFLTKFARKVTVVHRRDKLRAAKILQDRLLSNPKVEMAWSSVITRIIGKEKVEEVELKNVLTEKLSLLKADGVFVFIGFSPNTAFLSGVIDLDEAGCIITDQNMKTSIDGVYACGDCRKKLLRQVVTAAADGATAAFAAEEYIEKQG